MDKKLHPLYVTPGVPYKDGIRFLFSNNQIDVNIHVDLIWEILTQSNGHQSVRDVLKKINKKDSNYNPELVEMIIEDLIQLGVIVDSRKAFKHLHQLSNNPMAYSQELSNKQIRQYTASDRLPVKEGVVIQLPISESNLKTLQSYRRSCRSFSDISLKLSQIGHVLTAGYDLRKRTTPSAGGLYPLKIYLIVKEEQEDFSAGYYEYDPESTDLLQYSDQVDLEQLQYVFNEENVLHYAPVIIVIAADFDRHPGKYSNRGYRFTLLEAGHVAQNIHLAAIEQKLSCLEYGGFSDGALSDELGIDNEQVLPIIAIAIGHSSIKAPVSSSYSLLEELKEKLVGKNKTVRYVHINTGNRIEKGESFFGAIANYKAGANENARLTFKNRFAVGTATTSDLAQIKAIAEAFERFSSGNAKVEVIAKANDLKDRWINPDDLTPYTDKQYKQLDHLKRFDANKEWEWVRGSSLITGETVLVPVDLTYYPLSKTTFGRQLCYQANSNGVAAFTSESEATKRGLLELVERDCLMRSWLTREPSNKINVKILSLHLQRRINYWAMNGRAVHVLDLSNYGVSVACVIIVDEHNYPCFVSGASASLNSFNEAAAKAFHEAELCLLFALKNSQHVSIKPEDVRSVADHAKLYATPDHIDHINWLWDGDFSSTLTEPMISICDLYKKLDAVSVILSPENSPLVVMRVLSDKLVPINFGYGTEHYTHSSISDSVNPISLRFPHFFA